MQPLTPRPENKTPETRAAERSEDMLRSIEAAANASRQRQSRALATTAYLIILLWGVVQAQAFLVPVLVAALLAFLMAPLTRILRRIGVPEFLAVVLSAVALLLPLVAGGYLIVVEGQALINDFPKIQRGLDEFLTGFSSSRLAHRLGVTRQLNVDLLTQRLLSSAGQGIQVVVKGLGAILSAGSQTALVLLFAVLMLASRVHIRRSGERILARNQSIEAASMLDAISRLVERFLLARFLIVLIIGAIDFVILSAFGVRYAFLLGAFLGVMTLVPAIGFIIALIPPVAVSIIQGHSGLSIAIMALSLFGMSIVEGNVLTPKMVGKRLNINALTTFVGLFAGSLLWGIWGMLLAIPVLGIIRIAFDASPTLQPWGELFADKTSGEKAKSRTKIFHRRAGHA